MTSGWNDLPVAAAQGRLEARLPDAPPSGDVQRGERPLGMERGRDGVLFVPSGYRPGVPAPLLLCLHGAGGSGARTIGHTRDLAEELGVVLLAPDSRGATWDVIRGAYGADVAFIDRALARVLDEVAIDRARIGIEGFSDGASYALSLGIANGDLFTHILAFSPGFMAPPMQVGEPPIYMSHGTADQVLPIAMCSRRLAPQLTRAGYTVTYREFQGPHTVPPEIAAEAVRWFTGAGTLP